MTNHRPGAEVVPPVPYLATPMASNGKKRWVGHALGAALLTVLVALASCGGGSSTPATPDDTGASAASGATGQVPGGSSSQKPNIVLILTDDEAASDFANMPKTMSLIRDQGMTLTNYLVSYSLCCPSRVTTLRAQYAHNHGVLSNDPPIGGFQKAYALGLEKDTIATRLKDAGYRTGLFGKYLNGYRTSGARVGEQPVPPTYVPPGWTRWASTGSNTYRGDANVDGKLVSPANGDAGYQVDVTRKYAVNFIKDSASKHEPFFAYVAPYAPHAPAKSAERHNGLFKTGSAPRPPSFNEADVSQKPAAVADQKVMTATDIAAVDERWRNRQRALQSVDEMVEAVVNALKDAGQLDNTYIVVTSDNGWMQGEHRITSGKSVPYEPSVRVSAFVRGPGIAPRSSSDAIVGNVDLATTFSDLAGVAPADFVDGRSFTDVLGIGGGTGRARTAFLLEQFTAVAEQGDNSGVEAAPHWFGFRTATYKYIHYADGFQELYDLRTDPDEVENLVQDESAQTLAAMAAYLDRLEACKAATCRAIEDEQPPPLPATIRR